MEGGFDRQTVYDEHSLVDEKNGAFQASVAQ